MNKLINSTFGTPLGAGGIPVRSNFPSKLLSLVKERSPSKTWIKTPGWLSEYVEKTCNFILFYFENRKKIVEA